MTPELNREYPELDDPKVFEQMVNLTVGQMKPVLGHLRRGQHAKATGCVTAEFNIADGVPSDLRRGIFRQLGHAFSAIVRFSNSPSTFDKDGTGTARGLARRLGDQNVASILQQTLDEEGEADKKLTAIAESQISASGV